MKQYSNVPFEHAAGHLCSLPGTDSDPKTIAQIIKGKKTVITPQLTPEHDRTVPVKMPCRR